MVELRATARRISEDATFVVLEDGMVLRMKHAKMSAALPSWLGEDATITHSRPQSRPRRVPGRQPPPAMAPSLS